MKTNSLIWFFGILSLGLVMAACTPMTTGGQTPGPTLNGTDEGAERTVEITARGFEPATIEISRGDTVTWVNLDTVPHWPASARHPTHEVYPQGGGCIGSAFDSCKGLNTGESWSFQFNESGNWSYHDHIIAQAPFFGSVIVD